MNSLARTLLMFALFGAFAWSSTTTDRIQFYFNSGKYSSCIQFSKTVITGSSSLADKYFAQKFIGKSCLYLRNYDGAIAEFKKMDAFRVSSDQNHESQELIGNAYFLKKDFNAAIQSYQTCMALSQNSQVKENCLLQIARSYRELKDFKLLGETVAKLSNASPAIQSQLSSLK